MTRHRDIIAEFNILEVLRESVSQALSRLTDVQGRTERAGDSVNDVARSAGKGVIDMLGTMTGDCEGGGVGEVGASVTAWAGAGERASMNINVSGNSIILINHHHHLHHRHHHHRHHRHHHHHHFIFTYTDIHIYMHTEAQICVFIYIYTITHAHRQAGYWSLSLGLCNFYVTSDVMMCTASIMHLCTISVDRYIGIRYPLKTRNKSKGTVAVKLLIVWSLSLVVSSPITVLGIVDEHNLIIERRCLVNNDYFIIYGSIIAFFIPLVIMVVTNVLTMQLLNEQARLCSQKKDEGCPMIRRVQGSRRLNRNPIVDKRFQTPKSNTTSNTTKTVPSTRKWAMDSNENRKLLAKNVSTAAPKVDKGPSEVQNQGDTSGFSANSSPASPRPSKFRYLIAKHNITSKAANRMLLRKDLSKENAVQTERKATKVLAVVFTIFVVSWAPFFTTNVMTVLCKWCHVDQFLFVAFVWLGYISSTLNPIIYTIFNRTFKATFIKLMVCDYSSFGRLNRTQSLKGIESSTYYHGFSSSERNHESLC
uniref:G-protein coupled receptors family 1 profile domain-containing protein n=1 Tax=Octopus bimaculoides TaxID=37653 RepID=A0A0L8GAX9_OCTBM